MPEDVKSLTPQEENNRDYNLSQSEVGSPLKTLKGTPIKRYKNLVGKEVSGQIYLHKDYVETLLTSGVFKKYISFYEYEIAREYIESTGIKFNCVMIDPKRRLIRFDEAPDFDTAREPIPGQMAYYYVTKRELANTGYSDQIWHHKWLWVMNDYSGFDVKESWEWSKTYLSVLKDTGEKISNRGIANGTGHGDSNWRAQLRYFGLEEGANMNRREIQTSIDSIRRELTPHMDMLRAEEERMNHEDPYGTYIDKPEESLILSIIDEIKELYHQYNSGSIDLQQLGEKAKNEIEEIIFQYNQANKETKPYLEDILDHFGDDLIEVGIDINVDSYSMSFLGDIKIEEAQESMDGNRPFDQALELMDKFEYTLMDYDEGVVDKDTVAQRFSRLKSKIAEIKSGCDIEDRTFLNMRIEEFGEYLKDSNIQIEECDESAVIAEGRTSVPANGKSYPVKDKSYLQGKLAGYGNDMGLEHIMTVKYKNGDKYQIYDSGIGNMGSSYACAVKVEESRKITESSQSPMIFKAGNVYKLTPTESYPYDRVEILGIAWNDMIGQCTIQYKVVMKDGSVEEGQSEAGDLISTIKKNNEDRVEFYRTAVPKMND